MTSILLESFKYPMREGHYLHNLLSKVSMSKLRISGACGSEDGPPGQQPRPQAEGAVVHDGVLGEAQHCQVHTQLRPDIIPSTVAHI